MMIMGQCTFTRTGGEKISFPVAFMSLEEVQANRKVLRSGDPSSTSYSDILSKYEQLRTSVISAVPIYNDILVSPLVFSDYSKFFATAFNLNSLNAAIESKAIGEPTIINYISSSSGTIGNNNISLYTSNTDNSYYIRIGQANSIAKTVYTSYISLSSTQANIPTIEFPILPITWLQNDGISSESGYPDGWPANYPRFVIGIHQFNYRPYTIVFREVGVYFLADSLTQSEMATLFNNVPVKTAKTANTDPYTEIVPSSITGGGDGNGDFTDDTIDEPTTPAISGLNSGFISAYSPTVAQLNALASYMWTSDFATNLNKVFGDNPMGTILGLSSVPVTPTTGNSQNVILGNVDTEIVMPVITSQYVKFNCGSINIQPKYGAFLDYEPYTSIDLFLPYIGLVQLSTNDVMGKSLAVTYTIDVLSGACVANVACGGTIMYTFEGACATQFPVTNNDYSNMFKAAIDAASSIVGAIGGAVASGLTGNVAGAVGAIADGMAGAAQAAMNAHPVVNRSGSLSGSAGLMGIQKPFIVWTTPNMVASNNQNSFIGYPNFITTSLSSLSGYTEVENINLGIAGATNEEVNEIKTLLRNGVIF